MNKLKILGGILPDMRWANLFYLALCFRRRCGRWPKLKNPLGFNEKLLVRLAWEDRCVLRACLSDKEFAKDFVADRVGRDFVIPTLGVFNQIEQVRDKQFDMDCIAKPTHLSGEVCLLRKGSSPTVREFARMNSWLCRSHFPISRQRSYKLLEPKIIVEELLLDSSGKVPFDVKVHCFKGVPQVWQFDYGRFSEHRRDVFWLDGKRAEMRFAYDRLNADFPLDKATQKEVLRVAAALSRGWAFVRVDFYCLAGRIKVGELTFWPGNCTDPIEPVEMDIAMGLLL